MKSPKLNSTKISLENILSQIILDNTAAAEQIPKDASGRFLLHDGTVFQAYWFDDTKGL